MSKPEPIWPKVYRQMQQAGAGAFIDWRDLETIMTRSHYACRSALARARQELEKTDGLTIVGQDEHGITLGPCR